MLGSALVEGRSFGNEWIIDCGATKHCTPFLKDLARITKSNPTGTVRVGNGKQLRVAAVGTVHLRVSTVTTMRQGGRTRKHKGEETLTLTNVLVVPQLACRHSARVGGGLTMVLGHT